MKTKEQILHGDKLICEFLGGKIEEVWVVNRISEYAWKGKVAHEWRKNKLKISIGEAILVGQLEFNKSHDWLMEVVDKIETMDYGFKLCRKVAEVYIDSTKETIIHVKEDSRLNSLYAAVVQFIEYFNNLKQK